MNITAVRVRKVAKEGKMKAVVSITIDDEFVVHDIKVIEESPAGSGLAQAGKDAIARMTFAPAEKDGKAVAFCGMEQPFEVKFRD